MRALGFNLIISFLAMIIINGSFSYFTLDVSRAHVTTAVGKGGGGGGGGGGSYDAQRICYSRMFIFLIPLPPILPKKFCTLIDVMFAGPFSPLTYPHPPSTTTSHAPQDSTV